MELYLSPKNQKRKIILFEVVLVQCESSSELHNLRAFSLSAASEPRLSSQAAGNVT